MPFGTKSAVLELSAKRSGDHPLTSYRELPRKSDPYRGSDDIVTGSDFRGPSLPPPPTRGHAGLLEEQHVVLAFCGAAKRDGVAKKVAKYNEKSGDRIAIAWAGKD